MEAQLVKGISKQERSQRVRTSDSSQVFTTCGTISAALCPILGHRHTIASPAEDNQGSQEAEVLYT